MTFRALLYLTVLWSPSAIFALPAEHIQRPWHGRSIHVETQRPFVTSLDLQSHVNKEELMEDAKLLQGIADNNNGTRKWGSPGHEATMEWIFKRLEDTGYYDVRYEYFNLTQTKWDQVSLVTSDDIKPNLTLGILPGDDNEEVTAELVLSKEFGCNITDYPKSAKGKIALASRGGCSYGQLNAAAAKAGAVGLIVHNNDEEPPEDPDNGNSKKVGVQKFIPSVFIDKETGLLLKTRYGNGEMNYDSGGPQITISRRSHQETGQTANIIADTKCGNANQVILSGAHSDSVAEGPGINDNGSGTISQLQVALALTKYEVKIRVRFCWWTAEEDGMLGSIYYATHLKEEEKSKIVLSLDFDMMASPNYVYYVYDSGGKIFGPNHAGGPGSDDIADTFTNFFTTNNLSTVAVPYNDNSDYVGFNMVGIPSGGIATGAGGMKPANEAEKFGGVTGEPHDKCYHQACDRVDNLNTTAWVIMTRSIADIIAKYAMDISGIPFPRDPVPVADTPGEFE